jgi:cytidine deaminase
LRPELGALVEEARRAAARAYAPYSGFRVGAAVLAASGKVYTGCNVENSSFPVGLCAERNALAAAVAAGEREMRALAVAGAGETAETAGTLAPCGMCLQFMSEFGDLEVVSKQRAHWVVQPLSVLLPQAFRLEKST